MAIINSVGVGSGSKSVGEFTYRSVRGRTIASKRVLKNSSNSAAQGEQRSIFGAMSKFLSLYDCLVFNGFSKTRFGSRRNRALAAMKALGLYVRDAREQITADGTPLNLSYYWYPRMTSLAQLAVGDGGPVAEAIQTSLLQASDIGVSVASIGLDIVSTSENPGAFFTFGLDKCGAELLEIIRAKKPTWASLSDAVALQRAFTVASYAITPSGRGVSLGEVMTSEVPRADSITPIGSYVTPSFRLLTNIPLTGDLIDEFGLNGQAQVGERVYVFNILKFLGSPVNLSFEVATSTIGDNDYMVYPYEP